MPPLPRISVPALQRLAQELRFAPRDAILRDLDHLESLAPEIRPDADYPEDWITFRITGYRTDAPPPGTPLVRGAALLADLSALAERLSTAANLSLADLSADTLTLESLASRWNMSRKTIERLRRQGLVARRVLDPQGKWRLAFTPSVLAAFASARPELIFRASSYSRMEPALRARVLRRAALYRAAGLTLNQAALRIARRYQRSHEAIRQQLIGNDRRSTAAGRPPIFGWRGPTRPSHAEQALAAVARGIEPRLTARDQKRSPHALRRAINIIRAERLMPAFPPSTPALSARAATLGGPSLDAAPANTDIGAPGLTDLLAFITAARRREVPLGVVERVRAVAYRELLARAGAWTAALDRASPSPADLDRIETALRWASRLKVELVRAHLALIVQTIEERAELRLDEQRAARAAELVDLGIHAACRAIDTFEPAKGGRLAAPITFLVTREISRWVRAAPPPPEADAPGRASPRLARGTPFPDWTRTVSSWQQWLEPDPFIRPRADAVADEPRRIMAMRMGWPEWMNARPTDTVRPRTCAEISDATGLSATAVARFERRAIREALAPIAQGAIA